MTELHIAAYFGCSLLVKQFLDRGSNIEVFSKFYGTPLCAAIIKEQKEIVEILLDAGANVEACDHKGLTMLNIAVTTKNVEIVELLLKRGANVNSACQIRSDEHGRSFGMTPLLTAVSGVSHKMAQLLLDHGADVDMKGYPAGFAPIHAAALSGDQKMFEVLLQHKPDLLQFGYSNATVLMAAVYGGHVGIVKSVLSEYRHLRETGYQERKELNIDSPLSSGETPLEMSLQHQQEGSYEITELLISEGADIRLCPSLEILPLEVPAGATPDDVERLIQEYEGKISLDGTERTSDVAELPQAPYTT